MKKLVFPLILFFALVSGSLPAFAEEIKLATLTKPGSPQRVVAGKFKELIEARSSGRFTITIDPVGLGTKEAEAIEAIQTNTLQMGVIGANGFEDLDPITRVISFPFLFTNEQQAASILDGPLGAAILRDLETIGCKGLAFSETGFRHLTNNIRPVKTLEDLAGLKIRITSSPLQAATWLKLGANPTPKSWPIYSDLEKGILDGQENPLWIVETYSFFEVQKYLTLTRHSYIAHIGVASLKWWETLSPQDQGLIKEAMVEASRFQRIDQRAKEAARLNLFRFKGMQIEERTDFETFRSRTARLKEMVQYREPRVQVLLTKMQEVALLPPDPAATVPEGLPADRRPADIPAPGAMTPPAVVQPDAFPAPPPVPSQTDGLRENTLPPQPAAPEFTTSPPQTEPEPKLTPQEQTERPSPPATEPPAGSVRQPTALELLDAPRPTEPPAPITPPPVQIIHEGRPSIDGEIPPPIIEERIPAQPDPVNPPPVNTRQGAGSQPAETGGQPTTSLPSTPFDQDQATRQNLPPPVDGPPPPDTMPSGIRP